MLRPIPGLVGWRYIRIKRNSKQPAAAGWTRPNDQPAQVKAEWEGNWGILCGDGDGAGEYLLNVDQDIKGEADGLGEFAKLGLPPTYTKASISGGAHSLYWVPIDFVPFKCHNLGLEFLGAGQQFLAPGSIIDGKEYPDGNGLPIVRLTAQDLAPVEALRGVRLRVVDDRSLVEGNRNNALFKRACAARETAGLSDAAVGELLESLNKNMLRPLPPSEINTIWKSVIRYVPGGAAGEPAPDPSEWVVETRREFDAFNTTMPRREHILGPFLTGMTAFLFGPTGHGKSFFQIGGLHAMSRGESFGPYEAGDRPFSVCYVDGEMHRFDTQERISTFVNWGDLSIWHRSKMPQQLNLADPAHQLIIQAIAENFDVMAFDNFHCLALPMDPNEPAYSPKLWQACQPLVAWFRDHNKLLWIADHANQEGRQQGDKSKQWNVEVAMALDATPYQFDPGLRFDVDIVKGRRKGDVKQAEFTLVGSMFMGSKRQSEGEWCQELFNDGLSRKEIEDETGIPYKRICRYLSGQKPKKG